MNTIHDTNSENQILLALSGPGIYLKRCYYEITDNLPASILLPHLLYLWSNTYREEVIKNGCFFHTDEQIKLIAPLTKSTIETAKKVLKEKGFISTVLRGVPAKTHYIINTQAILEALKNLARHKDSSFQDSGKLESGIPGTLFPGIQETNYKNKYKIKESKLEIYQPTLRASVDENPSLPTLQVTIPKEGKKEDTIQAYVLKPNGKKFVVTNNMVLTDELKRLAFESGVRPQHVERLWSCNEGEGKFKEKLLRDGLYQKEISEGKLKEEWQRYCKDGYSLWARKDTPGKETKPNTIQQEISPPVYDGSINSRIQKFFYDEFGPKDFGSWLQNLEFFEIKDDKLVLKTNDKFKKDSIDARFKEKIQNLLEKMGFPALKTIEIIY